MIPSLAETVFAGVITMLSNGIGGLPFVFVSEFPIIIARLGWSVAGGMMLSASVFNLIIPGVSDGGITPVAIGVLIGTVLFGIAAERIGHSDIKLSGLSGENSRRIALVLGTMFFHSFPEGLAIGVAFGSGEVGLGLLITVAISIHNIPEGIAVSLPLRAAGVSGWRCVGWAIFSGIPQPLAAIPAYLAVIAFRPILPYAFGVAAGAMFYLVLSEMIPESRANEAQRQSSALAAMAGFLGMMFLQNIITI